jgi:hypothetical protein
VLIAAPILPICDAASARRLARALPLRRRHARIAIALRTLPEDQQRRLEARINGLYNACGCSTGAAALCVAAALWAGAWAWVGTFPRDAAWIASSGLVLAFVAMGTGKVLGLLLATRALRVELLHLAAVAEA